MDLTNDDVQDILHLLDGLPFGELHLETARFRLSLRRTSSGEWTQEMEVLAAPTMVAGQARTAGQEQTALGTAADSPPASSRPPREAPAQGGLVDVPAPLLGTFYRAPRPGEPPFVDVGSTVDEHTVVGIIETMKLMNSVAAGTSGTVAEICAQNAQFTEQGTVLMRIRADR